MRGQTGGHYDRHENFQDFQDLQGLQDLKADQGPSQRRVAAGALVVAAATTGTQAGLLAAVRWEWGAVSAPGPATLDEVVGLAAAVTACALVLWWGLGTLVAVGSHLPGRLGARCRGLALRAAPAMTRRVAAALVGVAVGGALVPGAAMADTPPHPTRGATSSVAVTSSVGTAAGPLDHTGPGWVPTAAATPTTSPAAAPTPTTAVPSPSPTGGVGEPGWTPTRPLQRPQAPLAVLGLRPAPRTAADGVVVHRGDTLWSIVASRLGPDASDAEVAAAWPAWHEANRAVIGDDPDLLVPGQLLRAPAHAVSVR